jgi:hypothetical protein
MISLVVREKFIGCTLRDCGALAESRARNHEHARGVATYGLLKQTRCRGAWQLRHPPC